MTGTIARSWSSEFQGKRYWHAILDVDRRVQTTDEDLGSELLELEEGYRFRALCQPSPKGANRFYLHRFVAGPEAAEATSPAS